MPDTPAERQRRRMFHLKGDHSLCRPGGPCAQAGRLAEEYVPWDFSEEDLEGCGTMERAALKSLSVLGFEEPDPRFGIAVIMVKLARQFDSDPSPVIAAELRRDIAYLTSVAGEEPTMLDVHKERIARKSAEMLIRAAAEPLS